MMSLCEFIFVNALFIKYLTVAHKLWVRHDSMYNSAEKNVLCVLGLHANRIQFHKNSTTWLSDFYLLESVSFLGFWNTGFWYTIICIPVYLHFLLPHLLVQPEHQNHYLPFYNGAHLGARSQALTPLSIIKFLL